MVKTHIFSSKSLELNTLCHSHKFLHKTKQQNKQHLKLTNNKNDVEQNEWLL